MPTASLRWGALVATSLLACSTVASAPTTPLPPPTTPVPPAADSAPPAAAPSRLTGFVDLFLGIPEGPRKRIAGHQRTTTTRFGRGLLVHHAYELSTLRQGLCPVTSEHRACGTFSLATGAAAADAWPAGASVVPGESLPADRSLKPGGSFAAPHEWVAFAGGRDAVYALRKGGKHVDRIDDQGKVTPFASDEAMAGWDDLWVAEPGGRVFLAGMQRLAEIDHGGSSTVEATAPASWQLAEALAAGPDGVRRLGPRVDLPMRPINAYRHSAQGVRRAAAGGKMALLGRPQVVPLPDDGADRDRWAMVWLELVAPDFYRAHGEPQRGVSRLARPVKRGARHSCVGPGSRGLDDASVTKRAHVTRFAGTRLLDDTVAWQGGDLGDPLTVRLAPRLDGEQVRLPTPARGRPATLPPEPEPGHGDTLGLAHGESVSRLVFDASAGEGLVVIFDNERTFYRRFDTRGQPLGEPAVVDAPGGVENVARIDGKWMALTNSPSQLFNLTDRTGPFELPAGGSHRQHLAATSRGGFLVRHDEDRRTLRFTPVGPSGLSGPALPDEPVDRSLVLERSPYATIDGTPVIASLEPSTSEGAPDHLAWRPATPGAGWQRIELPPAAAKAKRSIGRLRGVPGDAVVEVVEPGQRVLVWLKAARSASFEEPSGATDLRSGPVLADGWRLAGPGGPVADAVIGDVARWCTHSVATGPDTIVLGCEHPVDPVVPSLRVGLRTLTVGR